MRTMQPFPTGPLRGPSVTPGARNLRGMQKKHKNTYMKFCSISCLRCRSCQGFCGGHALHWTQDSGLQGFVAAMRCVGLTHTWAEAPRTRGAHSHIIDLTSREIQVRAVCLPLKYKSVLNKRAASSRSATPAWTGWVVGPGPYPHPGSSIAPLSQSCATSHKWRAAMADTPTPCVSAAGMCKQA